MSWLYSFQLGNPGENMADPRTIQEIISGSAACHAARYQLEARIAEGVLQEIVSKHGITDIVGLRAVAEKMVLVCQFHRGAPPV